MFSNGKIIDEVLKQRLENKVYTWSKEINAMAALKPNTILDKDPSASSAQCIYNYQNNYITDQISHFFLSINIPTQYLL